MYFPCGFLNNIFPPAHFIVRIQYITHITDQIGVSHPFMLSVRLLVNSRLLVVTFLEGQELRVGFHLPRGSGPQPLIFKGQGHTAQCL